MTLLSQIKGLFAPRPAVNHPALGPSIAVSRLASGNYYWETAKEIAFRGFSILVVFEAGEHGPSNAQAETWCHIKDDFEGLLEAAKTSARQVWERDDRDLESSDFQPTLVELPREGDRALKWELRLENEETGRGYLIRFKGDEPMGVEAD